MKTHIIAGFLFEMIENISKSGCQVETGQKDSGRSSAMTCHMKWNVFGMPNLSKRLFACWITSEKLLSDMSNTIQKRLLDILGAVSKKI